MTLQPEVVADYPSKTGENVLWHPLEKRVYWTDIPAGILYRYDPAINQSEQVYQHNAQLGALTVQADGSLLLLMDKGAVGVWRDGAFTLLRDEIAEIRDTRFNDAIADPKGRVFSGTMPPKNGTAKLLRLDPDGSVQIVLYDVAQSNGMGFTPDGKGFYHVDTKARKVSLYDYDVTTGAISNGRKFIDVPEHYGWADGMLVDADGFLWIAMYGGSAVLRYSPDGKLDQRIEIPTKNVTCPAFGGNDLTDLYVTTAGGDKRTGDDPHAGALFRIPNAGLGVQKYYSRIGL